MPKTYCIECDATITVNAPHVGDQVRCGECGVVLEVIDVDPLELDFPYEDDWDEDEDVDWDDEDEVD
jgi:lysine biosynthesis protein LysW